MANKRKILLVNGEAYHVFNKSIGGQEIFTNSVVNRRTIELLNYYAFKQTLSFSKYKSFSNKKRVEYMNTVTLNKPLVDTYAFTLMPNHFHLLLKQNSDLGISIFLSNFQNAFAKYFNERNNREGGVFKRPFKAKIIENEEVFLHVSRYIHINSVTGHIIEAKDLKNYPWTSFFYYAQKKELDFLNKQELLNMFGSQAKHNEFVMNQVDYQQTLEQVRDLTLE